jgi:hypothetical protein
MKDEEKTLLNLCDQILESDSSIRFAGIPNKMRKLIACTYS